MSVRRSRKIALALALLGAFAVATATFAARLHHHGAPVASFHVDFAPECIHWLDDDRLLVDSFPERAEVWSIEQRKRVREIAFPFSSTSTELHHAAMGDAIAVIATGRDASGVVRVVSASSGQLLSSWEIDAAGIPPWDLSASGDLVAFVQRDVRIEVRATSGAFSRSFVSPVLHPANPMFSPRGDLLGVESRDSIYVLATSDGSIAATTSGELYGFTRQGDLIVAGERDAQDRKPIEIVTLGGVRAPCCTLGPAESAYTTFDALVVESADAVQMRVEIRSLEGGRSRRRFAFPREPAWKGRLSPDGDRFAVAFADGRIEVWTVFSP